MTSKLETVNSLKDTQPSLGAAPSISSLPQEALGEIFSFLSQRDLQATASVGRTMNTRVVIAANCNEPVSIRNFIQLLIQDLNSETFSEQKNSLTEISKNMTFQNFKNLLSLKKDYILNVKNRLIDVMKTLDEQTTNTLESRIQPPKFMENIFKLSAIERQVDRANRLPDGNDQKNRGLYDASTALAMAGNIDRAIVVATSITNKYWRGRALHDMPLALARDGNIDRAMGIAMSSIFNESDRGLVLESISGALARAGNIDRAIAIATSLTGERNRVHALKDISCALARAGSIDRAIAIVTSLTNEYDRAPALKDISRALARAGDIGRAIAIVTSTTYQSDREVAFFEIVRDLLVINMVAPNLSSINIDDAIAIAELITDSCSRGSALQYIAGALARAGDFDRAIAAAELAPEDYFIRGRALESISLALARAGNLDRARDVAMSITDENRREDVLQNIFWILENAGDI